MTVKKDGYVAWSQGLELASGDDRIVEVVLEPLPAGVASPPPPPPPPPAARRFPWEAWAVTGALTIASVTTGILALDAASKLDTAKGRFDVTDEELHDASLKVKTFGLVTDILAISAVASAAVSLYFTLKAPAGETQATLRVAPWPGGLSAAGRF